MPYIDGIGHTQYGSCIIQQVENPFIGKIDMWYWGSCEAEICSEDDWATLYGIESSRPGNGHAQMLLKQAKEYYEKRGKKFGGTVALNPTMRHIYDKLGIEEYS